MLRGAAIKPPACAVAYRTKWREGAYSTHLGHNGNKTLEHMFSICVPARSPLIEVDGALPRPLCAPQARLLAQTMGLGDIARAYTCTVRFLNALKNLGHGAT